MFMNQTKQKARLLAIDIDGTLLDSSYRIRGLRDSKLLSAERRDFAFYRVNRGIAIAPVFLAARNAIGPRFLLHEVDQIGGIGKGIRRRLNDRHRDRLVGAGAIIAAMHRRGVDPLLVAVFLTALFFLGLRFSFFVPCHELCVPSV